LSQTRLVLMRFNKPSQPFYLRKGLLRLIRDHNQAFAARFYNYHRTKERPTPSPLASVLSKENLFQITIISYSHQPHALAILYLFPSLLPTWVWSCSTQLRNDTELTRPKLGLGIT
jgi:hypothetical protein